MNRIWTDARLAARSMRRAPAFTLTAILTLALGIGANSAIFSVVNGVLLKPLPFQDSEGLVGVWHTAPGLDFELINQSPALHFTYLDENRSFEDVGMWDDNRVTVTGKGEPERIAALMVTHQTLPMLRVQPALGRIFSAQDDSPGKPETVLLTQGYWHKKFGADTGVIGRTMTIEGRPRAIIGVLPDGFRFLNSDPAVLLPFQFDRAKTRMGDFSYQGLARLKPGVTLEQANADVSRMIPLAVERFPGGLTLQNMREARFDSNLRPFRQDAVGDVGATLWVLLGTVGLVLLIACANVANLFLVRAEGRQQELSIRLALGADRGNLIREFLSESVFLGVLGGLAGLALAFAGLRFLIALEPVGLPRLEEIGIDSTVLLFTIGISLLAGLVFGLFPVFKYGNPDLCSGLKEGGRGGSDGRERHRARNVLVVSQIALALVLLIGAGLMIRSLQALIDVHPGFERPDEILTMRISIPRAEVEDPEQVARTHERIFRRLEAIAGVESVGLTSSVTMDGWDSNDAVFVEDHPYPEGQLPPIRRFKWIGENYFKTMGNPVLAGRSISWTDIFNHAQVCLVTENFAREYWKNPAEAVGKRIRPSLESPYREIIGVVGNVYDDGVDQGATVVVYWPLLLEDFWGNELFTQRSLAYTIRSPRVGSPGLLEEARQAVWEINSNLPLARLRTQQEWLQRSRARASFTLVMLGIASGVALLLGVVGIYGVISYAVSQRTREIGVRMALGARQGDVSRMVLRQGFLLAGIGVILGWAAAFGLTRLMSSLLYEVNPLDPVTYGAVAVVLAAIALAASYLPARRAARVNPIEALRWE